MRGDKTTSERELRQTPPRAGKSWGCLGGGPLPLPYSCPLLSPHPLAVDFLLHPPKFMHWNPTPQCDGLWSDGGQMRSQGWGPVRD